MNLFQKSTELYAEILRKTAEETGSSTGLGAAKELVDRLVLLLNRIVVLCLLTKISANVGLADLEAAYSEVLNSVDTTAAVRLIDLTIKLDHLPGFPEDEVRDLYAKLAKNAFANTILRDLVLIDVAAVRANRAFRPADRLKGFAGLVVIVKRGVLNVGFGHDQLPQCWAVCRMPLPLSST